MNELQSIAIIGTGRVAHQLGAALLEKGLDIQAVYDRDKEQAEAYAAKFKCNVISKLNARINTDLVIIAVTDDAVGAVARELSEHNKGIIVHTSGAVAMSVIPSYFRRGVFYPLQSFSFDKKVAWENVPFCIEAQHDADVNELGRLAERISRKVYLLNSQQRKSLHLAAVFANNFGNLMFEFAEELLAKADIDRSILHPLILETANKVLMQPAADAQTGPARRGDLDTIRAHQELLGKDNALRSVYDVLTREIYQRSDHGHEL